MPTPAVLAAAGDTGSVYFDYAASSPFDGLSDDEKKLRWNALFVAAKQGALSGLGYVDATPGDNAYDDEASLSAAIQYQEQHAAETAAVIAKVNAARAAIGSQVEAVADSVSDEKALADWRALADAYNAIEIARGATAIYDRDVVPNGFVGGVAVRPQTTLVPPALDPNSIAAREARIVVGATGVMPTLSILAVNQPQLEESPADAGKVKASGDDSGKSFGGVVLFFAVAGLALLALRNVSR